MDWVIYYSNGSTISSDEKTPFSLQGTLERAGVQVIIQPSYGHGWVTMTGDHFYVWDDRGSGLKWWGADKFGFHHYLLQAGEKAVIFGETVDNHVFSDIFERARKDLSFLQPKEVFTRNERHP